MDENCTTILSKKIKNALISTNNTEEIRKRCKKIHKHNKDYGKAKLMHFPPKTALQQVPQAQI